MLLFRCLSDNAGDIAFINHITVQRCKEPRRIQITVQKTAQRRHLLHIENAI